MNDPHLRPMTREELDLAITWAAREGWNPGKHDAQAFWAADPEGFVVFEQEGEVIGTGSIVSYDGLFGFMGFFIIRPDLRHHGLGREFWHRRRDRLLARLRPGASIGMDGVFAMQPFYAQGGFSLDHRDLRFEGCGEKHPLPAGIVQADRVPFNEIAAFDAEHFPAPRRRFLEEWLKLPESAAFVAVKGPLLPLPRLGAEMMPRSPWQGEVRGYAVVRRCQTGCKIGPLFARDAKIAEDLFRACSAFAPGEPLFLDVPEGNAAAMALAKRHGMQECFGCARMYCGEPPAYNRAGVFGVTTFELG
jgi:hypothetical protein